MERFSRLFPRHQLLLILGCIISLSVRATIYDTLKCDYCKSVKASCCPHKIWVGDKYVLIQGGLYELGGNAPNNNVVYEDTKPGLSVSTANEQEESQSCDSSAVLVVNDIPPGAIIEKAFLWAESDKNTRIQHAKVNSQKISIQEVDEPLPKRSKNNSRILYRADITAAVNAVNGCGIYHLPGVLKNPKLIVIWRDPSVIAPHSIKITEHVDDTDYCEQNSPGCLTIYIEKDSGTTILYQTSADNVARKTPKRATDLSPTLAVIYVPRGRYYIWAERNGEAVTPLEPEILDPSNSRIRRR